MKKERSRDGCTTISALSPARLTAVRARQRLRRAWQRGLTPPERYTVGQWAERHIVLSERSTNFPGPYRLKRAPYCRGVMDAFQDRGLEQISLCWAAQTAKTQTVHAMLGYAIDQDPGPMLLVMPNADLARSLSETRLQPFLDACVGRHKPGDPDRYKLLEMHFDRMTLNLIGANSPANLASRPIRYLLLDEVDKFPEQSEREAAAVALAEERTKTFWNRKIVRCSTPTIATGQIWRDWQRGDMRRYWVPCPHCNAYQTLRFDGVKWAEGERNPDRVRESAWYECERCAGRILDRHKPTMLEAGQWRAERPGGRHASFHLSALYPIWVGFGQVGATFLESKDYPDTLHNFVNSWLAEPWEERGQAADEEQVLAHRAEYGPGEVPAEPLAVILTADVQQDAVYYVVRAWGKMETSWLVRYGVLPSLAALAEVARSQYCSPAGPVHATHAFVDSAFRTDEVYAFCRAHRAAPIKGQDSTQQSQPYRWATVDLPDGSQGGLHLLHVQGPYYKDLLQARLGAKADDPGAWHLHREVGRDYAQQLTAEVVVEKTDTRGRPVRVWKQRRRDNHYLDCEVYQLAAVMALGVRYQQPAAPRPRREPDEERQSWIRGSGGRTW